MKNKYLSYTLSLFVGLFFITSGFGKILNTLGFISVLQSYGFGYISYLAPLICVGEVTLGLFMILLINIRRSALFSLVALLIFTGAFVYAHFFKDVQECGCFGEISILNSSANVSFIRNGILILVCFLIYKYSEKITSPKSKWRMNMVYIITSCSLVLSGYTMSKPLIAATHFENENIKNTPLSRYVNTSADSTYLIFVFSYGCPHCWDATENMNRYAKAKIVDRIVGVSVENIKYSKAYYKYYKPAFDILNVPKDSISLFIKSVPIVFFIKNNKIQYIMQSQIHSLYTLKEFFPELLYPCLERSRFENIGKEN